MRRLKQLREAAEQEALRRIPVTLSQVHLFHPQNMTQAFRDFDFDGNPKWQQYKASLEIPAGKDVESVMNRFKAKWYRREIDPSFELGPASSSTAASDHKPAASPSSRPPGVPHNGASEQPTTTGTSGAPPRTGFFGRLLQSVASNHSERLFFMHTALLCFFVLNLQPFSRAWSVRGWGYFMQTALLSHGYKVFLKYGSPQLRPFSLAALKQWMVQASAATDFQYALLALVFMPSKPMLLVMIPITTLAAYHFFAYCSTHYSLAAWWRKYGAPAHRWLLERQQQALLYNAAAEIGAGFMVILALLSPPRSFFLVFVYWQFLRMRFWSPDAASYHRMAWSQLDAKFGRYLNYLPLAKVPVGYLQRWFLSAPGR